MLDKMVANVYISAAIFPDFDVIFSFSGIYEKENSILFYSNFLVEVGADVPQSL